MSESAYEIQRMVKRAQRREEDLKLWRMFYDHMQMATLTHQSISQLRKISHDRKNFNDPLRTFFKRVLYIHEHVKPEEKPSVDKRSLSPTTIESSGHYLKEGINEPINRDQCLKLQERFDEYAPTSPQFSPTYCDVYEPTSPIYDDSPPPTKKMMVEQSSAAHQSSSTSMPVHIPPMSAAMQHQRRSFDEDLTRKLHTTASGIQMSASSAAMHQQMRQRDQRVLEEQMQQHNHRQAAPYSIARDYRAPTPTPSVTSSGSSERSRAQRMLLTCPFCFLPHRPEKCEKYYTV
ncbi:hypothetical protein PRIPAC_94284 [Pristionchus pacificus]|nr:hypothetical protein PRIPAC_94284 [Pristionchus pacificus]